MDYMGRRMGCGGEGRRDFNVLLVLPSSVTSPLKSLHFIEPTGSFKYYISTHHIKMMGADIKI